MAENLDPHVQDFSMLTVLKKGRSISYIVPSFPVVTVLLCEVTMQWEDEEVFDGFMRECELLEHPLPAIARVINGFKNAFYVEVIISNFTSCMNNIHVYRKMSSLDP